MREAEPLRAAFFEGNDTVVQRVIDDPQVELERFCLLDSDQPAADAYRQACAIQREPMPLTGPLYRFALMQTADDEFYFFACCHHIVTDGIGLSLVCHRIAEIYSAVAFGAPPSPSPFGPLRELVEHELSYEASEDYARDERYWTANLPPEGNARSGVRQPGDDQPEDP
ncbi:condensation domain protein, partial [Mycolicibacterium hassiacum DSM 44199]